jgi:hypothetical protein
MKNKKVLFGLFICFLVGTFIFGITSVYADSYGLSETAGSANLTTAAGGGDVPTIIGNVIGTALSLISVLFFILMLYGGLLWMTARGKTEQTTKALDTIIAAIIGIVIILGAYALTQFVFSSVKGSGTTQNSSNAGTSAVGASVDVVPVNGNTRSLPQANNADEVECNNHADCSGNNMQCTAGKCIQLTQEQIDIQDSY